MTCWETVGTRPHLDNIVGFPTQLTALYSAKNEKRQKRESAETFNTSVFPLQQWHTVENGEEKKKTKTVNRTHQSVIGFWFRRRQEDERKAAGNGEFGREGNLNTHVEERSFVMISWNTQRYGNTR